MSPSAATRASAAAPAETPRERILRCATRLLAEGGPGALTMRAVGAEVGLHNSSLFHHFPGKGEIVAAVLARVNDGMRGRLEPLAADDPPTLQRLVEVLLALSDHYAAERDEARCSLRLLLEPGLAGARGAQGATPLWSWLARARAAGVVRPLSVGHAARSLLAIVLLEPAWPAGGASAGRDDPLRRAELSAFVVGALTPPT